MQHGTIRRILPLIVSGSHLGERERMLWCAGRLSESDAPPTLISKAFDRANSLPVVSVPDETPSASLEELLSLIADQGRDAADLCEAAALVIDLWSSASREERESLSRALRRQISSTQGPDGSWITRTTLRQWQRDQHTSHCGAGPASANVLSQLLEAPSPESAYSILSGFLGIDTDLQTLSWILGTLVEGRLHIEKDEDGALLRLLSASSACESLARSQDTDAVIVLVSQLSHAIWWRANRPAIPLSQRILATRAMDLDEAIAMGDPLAAASRARLCHGNQSVFWASIHRALDRLLDIPAPTWFHGLRATVVLRERAGRDRISPDDAATLAACLARGLGRISSIG